MILFALLKLLCDLSKADVPYLRHETKGKKTFIKKG